MKEVITLLLLIFVVLFFVDSSFRTQGSISYRGTVLEAGTQFETITSNGNSFQVVTSRCKVSYYGDERWFDLEGEVRPGDAVNIFYDRGCVFGFKYLRVARGVK